MPIDTPKRIGIIGETSGRVRDACIRRGHDAISCDILDCDTPGPHRQGDARDFDWTGFDLIVCHPPCTYLCNSGVRWLHTEPGRREKMQDGAAFFLWCLGLPCKGIGVENPVMHRYAREIIGRGPDFTIQPWQFGDNFKKRTCFWTVGLPPLHPTSSLDGSAAVAACHEASPGPNRWKIRSVTYAGIAEAIADQWASMPIDTPSQGPYAGGTRPQPRCGPLPHRTSRPPALPCPSGVWTSPCSGVGLRGGGE